ncbi:MAG: VWA domain-containing protein [Armatimonadetes bacterium]|nr:VWA domain-containing protein [Armatimonadota bacterium]
MSLDLSALAPGLRLAQPWALLMLALLPAWLWLLHRRMDADGGWHLPAVAWVGALPASPRQRLAWLPNALRSAVLVLLIIALARPQLGRETQKVRQKGVDIMLAVDVSLSMLARDIQPNRVEAAKTAVRQFLRKSQTDRVGLVVFGGRAFTLCPLTTDHAVVSDLVERCRVHMVDAQGTAVGDALGVCLNRLATPEEGTESRTHSRVVVLLTDGESNAGLISPSEAAEAAKRAGVRVHCVGVGSLAGAPVPVIMDDGREGFMTNEDQSLYVTRMEEGELRDVARATGGEYYRATDAEGLDRIYQRIARLEKSEFEVTNAVRQEERFAQVLMLAALVLLAELLLRATWLRVEV